MKVSFDTHDILRGNYDAAVLFTYEERSKTEKRFEEKIGDNVRIAREKKEFKGEHKQLFLDKRPERPRFCALVGLGKKEDLTLSKLREAAAHAAVKMRDLGASKVAIEPPYELNAEDVGRAVTEGAIIGTYRFTRYKTQDTDDIKQISSLTIVSDRSGVGVRNGSNAGRIIAEAVNFTRDLQNTPSSDMTPAIFAQEAVKIAKKEKLKHKVLDKKQLEKQGYGGILSVGRGSENEPRLVTLEYAPKKAQRTIAFVGKGVTFDSGGISIKPSKGMGEMKFDMSGAACVLGTLLAAAQLKMPVRIIGVMGLAENMPSGSSYKPGDVVTTKSGKTIEIDNTDAEGRIVLSDALHHASMMKPDAMIDFATLTGAVIVALGDVCAGVMGDDDIVERVIAAGEASGERAWRLPLWDDYRKDIDSDIADMKNMGMPHMAGPIAAAMLLKQFVDVPWAHLDIAGTAWGGQRDAYLSKKGVGTGYGVRLAIEFLKQEK